MIIIQQIKKLRNLYLRTIRFRHYSIGPGFHAGARVRIWGKKTVTIGKNFYIGRDSFIESDTIIGDNVIWANRVALVGRHDHHYQQPGVPTRLAMQIQDADYNWKGLGVVTIIEDDVWVGYNATILSEWRNYKRRQCYCSRVARHKGCRSIQHICRGACKKS